MQLGNLAQLFRFADVGFLWMVGYLDVIPWIGKE
jgi:hypothetical protein